MARRIVIAIVVVGGSVGLGVPMAGAAKDEVTLVSRQSASDGGFGADEPSRLPAVSANGRYVAFNSEANNLSSAATATENTFVRDLQSNTTTLVSRQSAGDGGAGADASSSSVPGISADGRYVAFASDANNLVTGENEAVTNIFVRDTQTNTTTLVSRQSTAEGGAAADDGSFGPSISGSGRYVAFRSYADNLSTAEADVSNIFVRDLQTNATTLVSRASGDSGAGGDDSSFAPAISADGRYVAFTSGANNLSTAANPAVENTFLRDLQANTTVLISRQSAGDGGAGANGDTLFTPSVSADGRFVAFDSNAANLASGTALGSIFVRDTQTNTTSLVSRQSAIEGGAPADASSSGAPDISDDGRYVAFASEAENLSSVDVAASDVFVRDLQANTTTLVSRRGASEGGASGDNLSGSPAMSADGRYVAFSSLADNLSGLDSDGVFDVFVYDYLGEPSPPDTEMPPVDIPPTTPATDTTAPELGSSSAKKTQKLGKALKVTVISSEDAALTASATATPKGSSQKRAKKLKFKSARAQATAGTPVTLKLKPSKKTARKLKAAAKAKAQITLSATDAAGNRATDTLKVKLR